MTKSGGLAPSTKIDILTPPVSKNTPKVSSKQGNDRYTIPSKRILSPNEKDDMATSEAEQGTTASPENVLGELRNKEDDNTNTENNKDDNVGDKENTENGSNDGNENDDRENLEYTEDGNTKNKKIMDQMKGNKAK